MCLQFLAVKVCAQQVDSLKLRPGKEITSASGQIVDALTGLPIPFISVKFTGTTYGTNADKYGKFALSASGLFKSITFSNIGYQSVTMEIKAGKSNELQIRLKPSRQQLHEVRITAGKGKKYRNKGNPAVELIQQIINHKSINRMESADYLQYDQYERIGLSFFHLSPRFINGSFFSKYKFMLDTTQVINGQVQTSLPVFFSEKLSQNYFRKKPSKSIQILKAQKEINIIKFVDTVGVNIYINRLYGNNIDLYENNIFIITKPVS